MSHVLGPADGVEVVEYGDFECPYCRRAEPHVRAALRELDGRVRFEWRHFPIADKHPHALRAAEAAEAAAAQERFWEYKERLLVPDLELEDDVLFSIARDIGLDAERMATEMDNRRYRERVAEDRAGGERLGVSGTPSFFVARERYEGFYDSEALVDAVLDALERR